MSDPAWDAAGDRKFFDGEVWVRVQEHLGGDPHDVRSDPVGFVRVKMLGGLLGVCRPVVAGPIEPPWRIRPIVGADLGRKFFSKTAQRHDASFR